MKSQRAWAWLHHLRDGGGTEWLQFDSAAGSAPANQVLPSPAHLETARRLNLLGAPLGAVSLVLDSPIAGRGLVGASLTGEGGSLEVDPAQLPAAELLRVCAAAIARHEVGRPSPQPPAPVVRSATDRILRHSPWQVVGISATAQALRAALRATGHPERDRRATVFVVASALDEQMAGHWHERVLAGAGLRWRRLWALAHGRSRLPRRADPLVLAREWSGRVGHQRVHVLLDSNPAAAVAEVLGVDPSLLPGPTPTTTDLLRRVNQVLAVSVPEDRHLELIPGLVGSIPQAPDRELGVPLDQAVWAEQEAERIAVGLGQGAWTVHGDTARVLPAARPSRRGVDPADTLDLALLTLAMVGSAEGGTDG